MVKDEGLEVLQERMKTFEPDETETYKFLRIEQADRTKKREVFERIKAEMIRKLTLLTETELNDQNLMKAINSELLLVAAYAMKNVCRDSTKMSYKNKIKS